MSAASSAPDRPAAVADLRRDETLDELLERWRVARAEGRRDLLPIARAAAARADRDLPPSDPRWRAAHDALLQALQAGGRMREMLTVGARLEAACAVAGDEALRFAALRRIALAGVELGEFGAAIEAAETAHRIAVARGDPALVAYALGSLGWCFERLGDPWQAERLMRDGLAAARTGTDERALFAALNNLAVALIGRFHLMRDTDDIAAARAVLREALPLAREAVAHEGLRRDAYADVVVTGNLGEVLLHLGDTTEAEGWLRHADTRAAEAGLVLQHRRNGANLGEALLARERAEEAWALLGSRLDQGGVAAADEPVTRMRLHHALARAAEALGRPADALRHLKAYLSIERRRSLQQAEAQARLLVTRREAEQARLELAAQARRAEVLEREAQRDPLTGLANRREADRRLPELLARSAASGQPATLAMLDLDRFKQVNDVFGHAVGDAVLRRFAEVVTAQLRGDDLLVRWGGEEFLLVLTGTAPEDAPEVAERLRRSVQAEPWSAIAPGLAVTVSIGLTSGTGPGPELLVRRADDALYRAKAAGRNRVATA